jgi:hypothetical protein
VNNPRPKTMLIIATRGYWNYIGTVTLIDKISNVVNISCFNQSDFHEMNEEEKEFAEDIILDAYLGRKYKDFSYNVIEIK